MTLCSMEAVQRLAKINDFMKIILIISSHKSKFVHDCKEVEIT